MHVGVFFTDFVVVGARIRIFDAKIVSFVTKFPKFVDTKKFFKNNTNSHTLTHIHTYIHPHTQTYAHTHTHTQPSVVMSRTTKGSDILLMFRDSSDFVNDR